MRTPLTIACMLVLGINAAAVDAKRPSIVFLLSDDQPLRAMGHREAWFHTPNMDRLAQEGVVFENGFVDSSVCCVSRASIMMGQHNATHLIQSFDDPLSADQILQSFPVLLRKAGYRTALLGKYAIGHTRAAPKELCLPAEHFDLWYGFPQSPSYAQTVDGEKRYLTSVMEEKAIRFMKETPADQPFMVYLCLPKSVNGIRSQMVLNYDLTATVMDVAGVPAPQMQGRSLVPVMKDPAAEWRKDWYYHHDVFSRGKGKLPKCEGVRTARWKYIGYKDTNPVQEELFDLQADPKETEDLAGRPEHAEILDKLRARKTELKTALATPPLSLRQLSKEPGGGASPARPPVFRGLSQDPATGRSKAGKGPRDAGAPSTEGRIALERPRPRGSFWDSPATADSERMLDRPVDLKRGELYVSFLAQRDAAGAFRVEFSNSKGQVRLGVSVDADGTVTPQGSNVKTPSAPGLFKADTAYQVVLKFSNDGTDKGAVTRVKLFPGGELPARPDGIQWDVAATGGKTGVQQDRVIFSTLTDKTRIEQFRIGKTWSELLFERGH